MTSARRALKLTPSETTACEQGGLCPQQISTYGKPDFVILGVRETQLISCVADDGKQKCHLVVEVKRGIYFFRHQDLLAGKRGPYLELMPRTQKENPKGREEMTNG